MMETAMCLIEANEPIYPIDILKSMRDQRAMLIQTSGQFVFVCSAIQKVYNEQIVRPLKEFNNQKLVVSILPKVVGSSNNSILQQQSSAVTHSHQSSSSQSSSSPSSHLPSDSSIHEPQQFPSAGSQMIKTSTWYIHTLYVHRFLSNF